MGEARRYEMAALIMAGECKEKFAELTKAEDMLRVAFRCARNHWMFHDEQDRFKGAIGAVLITLKSGPEFERVQEAVRALGRFSAIINALQNGVSVGFDSMEATPADVIKLNAMWNEELWVPT